LDPEDFIPPNPNPPDLDLGPTSPATIHTTIQNFTAKTSLDIDGISMYLLKSISGSICTPLSHIFNLSIQQGIFPDKLKISRTVPIFKSGNAELCDNYRPISLLSSISKIIEKIISIQLVNHLELNKLLYEHQYGFQKGKSTEHNLTHVTNFICNALNEKNFCVGLFLDLRKAFDVCSHEILLKKLKKYGIKGKTHEWFSSYLKNRIQIVDINGNLSAPKTFNISVIQGSILGPILFLIYINDLYTSSALLSIMFADDTACLAKNKNLNLLINFVNNELTKLARWFRANRMAVNVGKTKFILFHTRGTQFETHICRIFYNDNEPNANNPDLIHEIERYHNHHYSPEKRTYKLLGVNFDEHLSFDLHTTYLCNKLNRSLFCINRAKNFLTPKALISLYYAFIHSHLTYCPIILSCATASNIKKIQTIQKKAIRTIDKQKYNEHTAPIFKRLHILPFNKLIEFAKLKFMHSITYNYAPLSFRNTWELNSQRNTDHNLRNNDHFYVPIPRIELFKRSPMYTLPKLWNELDATKFHSNAKTFALSLRDKLLEEID
jgi:hypothetical protein